MMSPRNRVTGAMLSGRRGFSRDRRQLAVRVLDLTQDLVGHVARHEWQPVARLLAERRLVLEQIPAGLPWGEDDDCILALRAAMAESDRAVGLLLASAELSWPAGPEFGG